ncbi:TonB-dependent siderophore receptor [Bradyrhizobium sp. HKCCYLR20261]|uniref:TonB-dependent receptor n=1 Tax=unclassified Bradyrhizobium TaxID=2631580 RepID=UPI003EBAEC11
MVCRIRVRDVRLTKSLGLVSSLALTLNIGGISQALAQTQLPDVTVDAPKPRARQVAPRPQATPTRTAQQRRVAPRNLPPTAPVAYVTPSTGTIGAPPSPYAGGQVASGGGLGLLGNRGVMNTPFNQTSFTAKTIQDQQARTIRDVLINDPSVRTIQAAGGGADSLYIRGFYYDSGDYALNGLAGIAPYYSTGANFIERVELLKGPAALLNGMTVGGTGASSGGAVGGSVNLITKHALDTDITQLTATYASKTQFGEQVDISRRYGEHKEWGVRLSSKYSNGNTPWDRQTDEFGNAHLAVDYHGENVRLDADIGYQADNLNPPLRFFTIGATTTSIPNPPASGTNFQMPWAYYAPTDFFSTVKGEVDLGEHVTAYAGFGYHDSNINYRYISPTIANNGSLSGTALTGSETYKTYAGEAGLRITADTGPVNHAINVGYSVTDRTYTQRVVTGTPDFKKTPWSLYSDPTNIPLPAFSSTLAANQVVGANLWSIGVSDTMSILDKRIQLTVGARRQTAGTEIANFLPTGVSRPFQDTSVWTPAYALVIKPVEQVALYANYIEGLQTPAVVTGATFNNIGTVFPPGQTKQVETGIKVDFGRITTTLSAFDISRPSIISVAVPGQAKPDQVLNGLQRNTGAEFNVFGEVTPAFRLLGGVAYTHGVQEKTQGGATDGLRAVGVPELTANIGAEWDTPFVRDLTLTGRVVYTATQYVDAKNTMSLPDWTRVDIGARYTFTSPWNGKPIVLRAAVENVFDKAYWASAYSGVITLGAPRTYLVSTTFNF